MILKLKNNLMKSLILKMENFQEKVDLVKLENVKVILIIRVINIMQSKLYKIYQDLQILQKLKLYNKLKMKIIKIQLNITIADIDKRNKVFQFMNILQ